MTLIKIFNISISIIIIIITHKVDALTIGARFRRESENGGITVISPTNFTQIEPTNTLANITSPSISVIGPNLNDTKPTITLSNDTQPNAAATGTTTTTVPNDLEADNFIESLKKQAEGTEPKNKNETHISSEIIPTSNTTYTDPFANMSVNSNNTLPVGIDAQKLLDENVTNPISNSAAVATNISAITTPIEAQKSNNGSCPSDCSADSCKPECSFHCCLQQKESLEKESLGKYYQQNIQGINSGFEFNSAKLEKMLLDTISEFSQKLPTTQQQPQQPQKSSDMTLDPSKHYQYAQQNFDNNNNNNNFNALRQFSNEYLADINPYLYNKYSSDSYSNTYNSLDGFNLPLNQQITQKSQINPTYPYKRNNINYPKTPMASGFRKIEYIPTNYAYNVKHIVAPHQNKITKRSRIYSPYSSHIYV